MADIQKATEYKSLGNDAFKNKNYEQAIEHFTKAIEFNPNDHVFYSNRSASYLNLQQYSKALQDAGQCVKINPTWPRGYQRKGNALFYLNKLQEAVDTYKEGLTHDPQNQALQNDLKTAEEKLNQPEDKNPMMNQAYLQAAMKLISHPETKDFIQDPAFMQKFQTVLQNPGAASLFANDPQIKKAMEVVNSAPNTGFEEFMKNMSRNAPPPKPEQPSPKKEEQPQKREEKPSQQEAPPKKEDHKMDIEDPAEDIKNKGNTEFKMKNFPAAIQFYNQAIEMKPEEPLYYNNKAAAFIEMGNFQEALAELDKAEKLIDDGIVKDFAKKAKVYARRGTTLKKLERYDEAILYLEKSLVEDGSQKVRDELRVIKKIKKEKEDKEYINPELAEKACETGNAYFKEGKFPLALKEYEEAVKRNPDGAKYYSNLGTVYIKLMQWQRAKENFQVCLKKDPNYQKAYAKKGDCHYSLKEYHKALETYEAGLKLDPNNELCKAGVQKTQQAIYMSGNKMSQEEQQQRAQRAMADPEIQSLLNTPQVRNALNDLQSNPQAIHNIMKNPSLAQKIDKLIQAGVIGMG